MPETTPARLLVVDDELAHVHALCNTLRDEGYQVEGATSGEAALSLLRKREFDLVLTDLMMPRMDGIAFLRSALEIDPFLAGIVMTGHGSIPTAVQAMKIGAIDYVLKPCKLGSLLPVLDRAMTIRRLRVKNAELEKRVLLRTAELEAANKDLDAFCRSVSHDLRTPLRAIMGFADILVEYHATKLPPDLRRYIDLIHEGAGQMSQLITALLAFSRIGRQSISRESVDLERLCHEAFKELAGERAGRRVDLQVHAVPEVQGDPALLRQVVGNLLSNAVKYTRPRDAAVIEVGVAPDQGEGSPVFFIRDNGVGFDMRYAGKLFGVFQRLHHAREFEGTGVGLATVRRIIEGHGGRVWAEAVLDVGATFFFTIPNHFESGHIPEPDWKT